jgi:signal transduction histidine kinase/CheY-like chemotaxis protein
VLAKPESGPDGADSGARARVVHLFLSRHLLSAVVFVVVCALGVVASMTLHNVVHNQEHRLLQERASELAAFLKSSAAQGTSSMTAAGEAVVLGGPQDSLFTALAGPLTANGATVGVVQRSGTTFTTVAALGDHAAVGRPLDAQQQQIVNRAAAAQGLVFEIRKVAGKNHFIDAVRVPGTPETVVFLENELSTSRTVPTTQDSPYRELNVAVYAGDKPTADRLLIVSGALPDPSGDSISAKAPIGADSLLVVIEPRSPLVGSFAQNMPWIVLGGGIVLAILVAMLVDVLTRRRGYALALVEQRTREMYKAQMAAEAANRSKSEFLSRMSHELRTPLNAVLGFSQLLQLDNLTPDQRQSVDQIAKGGRHLLDLINEILDISQIETGTLALSPEAVNARDLVSETVDLVRPLAAERGVHLIGADTGACDVFLFADRQRLKQILLNLLGNGIKYNREGGSVSISCSHPTPGTVRIQVADTGPGIPREQKHLLFTPFERLGAEQTTIEGTGIGLALSRRLAEVMGGTLDVDSTVGRGSTFWVEFPVVEGPVERIERLDSLGGTAVVRTQDVEQPCVLHIEDNLSNVKLIERILAQRPDVNLIPAMQGRLGIELARQHRPILILLDLNLADISGDDVLQRLREDPVTAQIPVAIVSADATPRQVQRMLTSGATAYLTKPIDVRELLELVDSSLEIFHRRAAQVVAHVSERGDG